MRQHVSPTIFAVIGGLVIAGCADGALSGNVGDSGMYTSDSASSLPSDFEPDASSAGRASVPEGLLERQEMRCTNSPPEFVLPDLSNWPAHEIDPFITCEDNADCTDALDGYCTLVDGQMPVTQCAYGCETDGDCGPAQLCDCGVGVGRCVPAACRTSVDCEAGPCVRFQGPSICVDGYLGSGTYYDCVDDDDGCAIAADCEDGQVCSAYEHLEGNTFSRRCITPSLCGI